MSRVKLIIITILFLLALNLTHSGYSEFVWRSYSLASSAVVRSIGFTGLALSSECTATRNPILESVCGCLGDLPAGYCYHLSCAIVGIPTIGNLSDQIEVIRRGRA